MFRRALTLLVACSALLLGLATAGAAGAQEIIPPGHEAAITEAARRASAAEALPRVASIRVTGARIEIQLDARVTVGVARVKRDGAEELAPGITASCPTPCTTEERERARRFARTFARERDAAAPPWWSVADPRPEHANQPPPDGDAATATATHRFWLDRGIALLAVLAVLRALLRSLRALDRRHLAVLLALALTPTLVGVAVGATVPLHEHASFTPRNDCAWALDCDHDPRGPGWGATVFHVVGPMLHVLPYGVRTASAPSLFWGGVSLLLLFALMTRLAYRERDLAPGLPWFAVAALLVSPSFLRGVAADTFWPWVVAMGLGAALLLDELRATGRAIDAFAAPLPLAFVVASSHAMAPLVVLLPLLVLYGGWRAPLRARLALTASGGLALYVVHPDVALSWEQSRAVRPALWRLLVDTRVLFLDPQLGPFVLGALLVVGAGTAVLRPARLLALTGPLVLALPHPFLSFVGGEPLGVDYPVAFINHVPSLPLQAALAALGASALLGFVLRHRSQSFAAACIGLVLLVPLSSLAARPAWELLLRRRAVEREHLAFAEASARLPEHRVLVVPPSIPAESPGVPRVGDPVEIYYPLGAYLAAQQRGGHHVKRPVELPNFLARQPVDTSGVLFYLGGSLRSWKREEITHGAVPPTLERDALAALRRDYDLVPVVEFDVDTAQSAYVPIRYGADRVARLPCGFYRLVPRAQRGSTR